MDVKRIVIALAVLAGVVVGVWCAFHAREENNTPANAPAAPAKPAPKSSPLDLSISPPAISTATSVDAPPAIVVQEPAIRGHVVDGQGHPIADAAVCVYDFEKGPRRTFSDANGVYAIGPLDTKVEYRLSAEKEHYNEAIHEGVRAPQADRVLTLTAMSTARGRVIDEQGQPITEFEVTYMKRPPDGEALWKEIVRTNRGAWQAFQDGEGRFVVKDVASGAPFGLGARAQGFEPAYVIVEAADPGKEAPPAEIQLKREARISGVVLSPARTPVADAAVHLGVDEEAPVVATSDVDGAFELSGLGDTAVDLTATHDDFLPGTAHLQPQRGAAITVEILLGQGGEIEGIVWRGSEPAAGQTVSAVRLAPPRIQKQVITDEAGQYRIDGLGVGVVDVIAKWKAPDAKGAPLRMQQQAEIQPAMTTTVDFHFPTVSAALEGTISASGVPVAFAEIHGTVATAEGQSSFTAAAGEDGFYHIDNIVPGTAWVAYTAEAGQSELRRNISVELREGETTIQDVSFDTASGLTGSITNLKPGEVGQVLVLPGTVEVDTSSFEAIMGLDSEKSGESDIDEKGGFSITGLEPGAYTAVALIFSGEADTGDEALNSVRIAVQPVTVGAGGTPVVTLTLTP